MKKILFLIATTAMILTACQDGPKRKVLMSQNDSLQTVIAEREAALDEMMEIINSVENGFRAINEAQGRVNLNAAGSEISRKETLQNDILFIHETLERNKEQIEKLTAQLSKNKSASKQMQQMIKNLQEQLTQKSQEIESLYKMLAEKNIHIAQLDSAITAYRAEAISQEQTIQQQDSKLHTVWYAIGTKSELKKEKILKSGDVLRNTDANLEYFTKADMRELGSINTYAKKAKILTNHPSGSYKLEKDENKQYVLTITNAETFWSVSRYLVIQVR
ncbi:MAG: hypothetical protein IKD40_07720 [Bacteroidaceae bacterium]|nr:hypothetical protein [Bacteroidaceae bacterium]